MRACGWLTLALGIGGSTSVAAQDPPAPPPRVVVYPFTVQGYRADTVRLRKSATRFAAQLNQILASDSSVYWLAYRPLQRPRDPRTGLILPARYGVVGSLSPGASDSLLARFQVVGIETLELLLRDSTWIRAGEEATGAAFLAGRIVRTVLDAAARSR